MNIKTTISKIQPDGTEVIRGHHLSDLIASNSFTQTVFLVLQNRMPTESEEQMFNAILTATVDHGPGTTSALTARISASAKNPLHASLAAGLLGFGERHGVAVSPAMEFFYANIESPDLKGLLHLMKEQKKYVSGFGHKLLVENDPRTEALFKKAKELNIFGKYCKFAHTVHTELNAISSKHLPFNIDGGIAAILCDMGFDAKMGNGIFLIGRVPGLIAHILEEAKNDEGIRRLGADEVEFIG